MELYPLIPTYNWGWRAWAWESFTTLGGLGLGKRWRCFPPLMQILHMFVFQNCLESLLSQFKHSSNGLKQVVQQVEDFFKESFPRTLAKEGLSRFGLMPWNWETTDPDEQQNKYRKASLCDKFVCVHCCNFYDQTFHLQVWRAMVSGVQES